MEEKLDYAALCARFPERRLDEDELIMLKKWINESYENSKLFNQYNEVWQLSHVAFNEVHYNTDAGLISLQKWITRSSTDRNDKIRFIKTDKIVIWRVASVAVMFVAALFIGLFFHKDIKSPTNQFVIIQSPRGEKAGNTKVVRSAPRGSPGRPIPEGVQGWYPMN